MAADKDMDRVDREILRLLAADASLSLADIADRVGLTSTPCWKRIRRMEQAGVIRGRVATIDPAKVGLPVSVFVEVETADHSSDWLKRFADVVAVDAGNRRCLADERRRGLPDACRGAGHRGL